MKVQVNLPVEKILAARGLGQRGGAGKFLGNQVRQRCDNYVPKDTGLLKDTAEVSADGRRIRYVQPYAAEQFYGEYRHADPNRGDHWHRRMLSREKAALLDALRRYMAGR